jgi:hypothetical protein
MRSPVEHDDCTPRQVMIRWSQYLGGLPVFLARNLEAAREQLLQALNIRGREQVLLPANATHGLVEAIKRSGARPVFGELDSNLALCHVHPFRIAWSQPVLGLSTGENVTAEITVLEHGDTLPNNLLIPNNLPLPADVAIFGLHLSTHPETEGALLVFNHEALYARFMAVDREVEPSLYRLAAKQVARVWHLAAQQQAALTAVSTGLQAAAGLPVLPVSKGMALAHGVAVRIPDEGSPSTFWAYASRENTPIEWLPELRPIHYAAALACPQIAAQLERWLLVLVSPDNNEEANKQAVLGIVKPAEYMGLRWRTDPARAAQYAALLNARYGLDHDAYRPAFSVDASLSIEAHINAEDVRGPTCQI